MQSEQLMLEMEVLVDSSYPEGRLPVQAREGDAGLDLFVKEATIVPARSFADIDSGCSVALPPGTFGWIVGRSSTLRNRGLLVNQGIIDNGYTGSLFAGVWNLNDHDVVVTPGERIAQLILLPLLTDSVRLEEVDQLPLRTRGGSGFGSTGA